MLVYIACILALLPVPIKGKFTVNSYCFNAHDQAVLSRHSSDDFKSVMNGCGCFGGVDCSSRCLVNKLSLTTNCAHCFGENIHCIASHCFSDCLNPYSLSCDQYADEHCLPALVACSGCQPQGLESWQTDDFTVTSSC